MRPKLRLSIIAGAAALLSACATAPSELRCPPLRSYTPADQARAAGELAALLAGAMLPVLVDDYGELRAACRAMRR